jgi:iron complex transport system ATP-binding protein
MSYGKFRKILIARAIVNASDILVLDEPCSGLDNLSREDLLDFLDRVCRSNTSVILAAHHFDELIPSITHVMLLGGGKIVAQGKKEEILPRVMQELSL